MDCGVVVCTPGNVSEWCGEGGGGGGWEDNGFPILEPCFVYFNGYKKETG